MSKPKSTHTFEVVADGDGFAIRRSDGLVSQNVYPSMQQAEGIVERGARVKFTAPRSADPQATQEAPAAPDAPETTTPEGGAPSEPEATVEATPEVEPFDPSSMTRAEMLDVAKAESAAKKSAMQAGEPVPATPVLDYMNSADWKMRKDAMPKKKSGGGNGGTGGGAVRLSEAQIEAEVKRLIAAGVTTKAAMLKQLREEGKGTRQQRLFPIAERLIAAAVADGTIKPVEKAAKAPRAKGAKASASKAAAATKTAGQVATEVKAHASLQDRREQQGKADAAKRTAKRAGAGSVAKSA